MAARSLKLRPTSEALGEEKDGPLTCWLNPSATEPSPVPGL